MKKIISINPTNFGEIGEVTASTKKEIEDKVNEATEAKQPWKELGLKKRVSLLRKVVEKLEENKEAFAKLATQEMGMPITQSRADINDALFFFNWYLDHAEKYLSSEVIFEDDSIIQIVEYEPVGVAAVITPWNFPLSNFVWGAGQNLIAGNTVVYKSSEECLLFAKALEKIIESVSLPKGVFSIIYGDGEEGEYLANQPVDLISFTGSSKVGQELYLIGAKKFIKVVCELGGSAPGIVLKDADVDKIIETIYSNRFTNGGQMCDALKRLIVHQSLLEEVIEKLIKVIITKPIGDPFDEKTEIGPLVSQKQLTLLETQVNDAINNGASLRFGGKRVENFNGAFYQPTILTITHPHFKIWQEEVFGPVLPIMTFTTIEEAIRLANDTSFGLGGYIYTKNNKKALEIAQQLETGMVSINTASYINPASPFGGYKLSGLGREHGKFGFAEVTQVKVIATEK
jgi:acyl-CoA reductase-like NAD-dependent aldehyde dehydrogenase